MSVFLYSDFFLAASFVRRRQAVILRMVRLHKFKSAEDGQQAEHQKRLVFVSEGLAQGLYALVYTRSIHLLKVYTHWYPDISLGHFFPDESTYVG